MPTSPILLAQMETFRSTRDGGLDHPPGFDGSEALAEATPFHRWLRSEGREAYSRFLLTHPGVLFGEGLEHLDVALLDPQVAQYASSSSPWDGAAPSAVVNPRRARLAAGAALLAVSLALAAAVLRGPRREWAAPAALLALCLPFALFVYHGGALEPARHGVVPSLMLRLGALTLLLFALDRLAERRPGSDERTARRRPAETVEAPAEPAPA